MTEAINGSGIRPAEYNIIVLPKRVEEKTKGGLLLPDEVKEKEEFARKEGVLVAMSPMAFKFADWPEDREDEKPKIGQTVVFPKYQAEEFVGADGRKYWLMKDKAIIGVKE